MGKKAKIKKGKKPHKNKPTSKKYTKYKVDGDTVTRERNCPRCGPGIFLMQAQGRVYCGKCHYSEFGSKTEKVEAAPKEIKEDKSQEVKKE